MSTHEIKVVRLGAIEKHPNADSLGITHISGYNVIVRLSDWKEGDLGVYIEPDYVVPENEPEFLFLNGKTRIKVKRLRGVISHGLLIKARSGMKEGDDVMNEMRIVRYEPPISATLTGEDASGPSGIFVPVYDLENWRKFRNVFQEDEEVFVTEKLHGCNSRFLYHNGQMFYGSRTRWKKDINIDGTESKNVWFLCVKQNPWIEEWCRNHEDLVLFGEVYGQVQDLKYGVNSGFKFRTFDILNKDGTYVDAYEFRNNFGLTEEQMVPLLYHGAYNSDKIEKMADGKSTIQGANHIREGIVIKPRQERFNEEIGRAILKIVSDEYLEKA
jgi:RNA ligase (TIGR02306 family)